jgi:hypothetical protein
LSRLIFRFAAPVGRRAAANVPGRHHLPPQPPPAESPPFIARRMMGRSRPPSEP